MAGSIKIIRIGTQIRIQIQNSDKEVTREERLPRRPAYDNFMKWTHLPGYLCEESIDYWWIRSTKSQQCRDVIVSLLLAWITY